ncbi:MAG TPA: hypothetical protein VMZ26_12905 [Pyrinomonadaceae bacterium]|nr:hypothetical protein [Pyrinomonadaceae bacterium]
MSLTFVILRDGLSEKRSKCSEEQAGDIAELPAVTFRLLAAKDLEPTVSVTEETTNLLPSENVGRTLASLDTIRKMG